MREAAQAAGNKPRYDGRARDLDLPERDDPNRVIRFKNPLTGDVSFDDKVKGRITWSNTELDDLVLIRSDGFPTYNFAVVVDDLDMKITDVIRGDDHVNNTPRQVNLYDALGAPVPAFAHLPMILGRRRHQAQPSAIGAVGVMQYRDDGYLPHALLNYLVRLGWSHGDQEIFSIDEMRALFRIEDVNHSASRFDTAKLGWLNQQYLKHDDPADVAQTPGVAPAQRRLRPRQWPRAGGCRDRAARPRADAQGNVGACGGLVSAARALRRSGRRQASDRSCRGAASRSARATGQTAGVDGRSGRRRAA